MSIDPSARISSTSTGRSFALSEGRRTPFRWEGSAAPSQQQAERMLAAIERFRTNHPGNANRTLRLPYTAPDGTRGNAFFSPSTSMPGARIPERQRAHWVGDHVEDRGAHRSQGERPGGLFSFFFGRRPQAGVGTRPTDPSNMRVGPTRERARLIRPQVVMVNSGAIRNQPLNPRLTQHLERMSQELGVRIEVYSGGQPSSGSRRTGSTRHNNGMAADVRIYRNGHLLRGDQLAPVVDYWFRNNIGGVGFGMDNGARDAGVHLDLHRNRPPFWAYSGTRLPPNVRQTVRNHHGNGVPALHYA
ncbi:MAG: hypothetical protein AAFQ65_13010 [Myxococcota bacterium]